MRRECDIETAEDFRRYYARGWIGLPEENHITPIQFAAFNSRDNLAFYCLTHNPAENSFAVELKDSYSYSWEKLQEVATFGCPEIGMVRYGDGEVIFGASLAERQWHRGLHLGRVQFHNFNRWHLRNKVGSPDLNVGAIPGGTTHDLVWRIFNPEYSSFPQAFAELQSGTVVGLPLSRLWGMYTVPNCPFPLVAYKRWTLGYAPSETEIRLGDRFKEYSEDLKKLTNTTIRTI